MICGIKYCAASRHDIIRNYAQFEFLLLANSLCLVHKYTTCNKYDDLGYSKLGSIQSRNNAAFRPISAACSNRYSVQIGSIVQVNPVCSSLAKRLTFSRSQYCSSCCCWQDDDKMRPFENMLYWTGVNRLQVNK